MIKFLVDKNGDGPYEIDITDEKNLFGVAVIYVNSGQKVYVREKEELFRYCSDTIEESFKMRKEILETHLEFFKTKVDEYTKLLQETI